ncbi:unnamed protein product [Brassica oleracea]
MVANQITTDFLRLAEKRPNDPNSASVRKNDEFEMVDEVHLFNSLWPSPKKN